jgi:hypothetical protein
MELLGLGMMVAGAAVILLFLATILGDDDE